MWLIALDRTVLHSDERQHHNSDQNGSRNLRVELREGTQQHDAFFEFVAQAVAPRVGCELDAVVVPRSEAWPRPFERLPPCARTGGTPRLRRSRSIFRVSGSDRGRSTGRRRHRRCAAQRDCAWRLGLKIGGSQSFIRFWPAASCNSRSSSAHFLAPPRLDVDHRLELLLYRLGQAALHPLLPLGGADFLHLHILRGTHIVGVDRIHQLSHAQAHPQGSGGAMAGRNRPHCSARRSCRSRSHRQGFRR